MHSLSNNYPARESIRLHRVDECGLNTLKERLPAPIDHGKLQEHAVLFFTNSDSLVEILTGGIQLEEGEYTLLDLQEDGENRLFLLPGDPQEIESVIRDCLWYGEGADPQ